MVKEKTHLTAKPYRQLLHGIHGIVGFWDYLVSESGKYFYTRRMKW